MTLTPYDTGEVLEPHVWVHKGRAGTGGTRDAEPGDYGKVDFDDDSSTTILTIDARPKVDDPDVSVVDVFAHSGTVEVYVETDGRTREQYTSVHIDREVVLEQITRAAAFGATPWDALVEIAKHVGLGVGEDEQGHRYVVQPG